MTNITRSKRQAFFDGMARTLDIGGTRTSRSPIARRYLLPSGGASRFFASYSQRAALIDKRSLASDWRAVGDDIRAVIKRPKPGV